MPRDEGKDLSDRLHDIEQPIIAWYGQWKVWLAVAAIAIVGLLVYAAL